MEAASGTQIKSPVNNWVVWSLLCVEKGSIDIRKQDLGPSWLFFFRWVLSMLRVDC